MNERISPSDTLFEFLDEENLRQVEAEQTHVYRFGTRCVTDTVGHAQPAHCCPSELVLNATTGFIPLWDKNVTLNWRFNPASLKQFRNPDAVEDYVRKLLAEAISAWAPAIPVRFSESQHAWDFEIVLCREDDTDLNGRATLASAFFPDGGQHQLTLYPKLFAHVRNEQLETLAHELGHMFGLRHFFAKVGENGFPSRVFGSHAKFSVMNSGPNEDSISDVVKLYTHAWSGAFTHINGTPIRLVRPYSANMMPGPSPLRAARRSDCPGGMPDFDHDIL